MEIKKEKRNGYKYKSGSCRNQRVRTTQRRQERKCVGFSRIWISRWTESEGTSCKFSSMDYADWSIVDTIPPASPLIHLLNAVPMTNPLSLIRLFLLSFSGKKETSNRSSNLCTKV